MKIEGTVSVSNLVATTTTTLSLLNPSGPHTVSCSWAADSWGNITRDRSYELDRSWKTSKEGFEHLRSRSWATEWKAIITVAWRSMKVKAILQWSGKQSKECFPLLFYTVHVHFQESPRLNALQRKTGVAFKHHEAKSKNPEPGWHVAKYRSHRLLSLSF
jgi:hypothetical protein